MNKVEELYLKAQAAYPHGEREEMTPTLINDISTKLMDIGLCGEILLAAPGWLNGLLSFLLSLLNDHTCSQRVKTSVLLCFLHFTKVPNPAKRETVLLPVVLQIGASLEDFLEKKNEAANDFGTLLGRQHEYMLVILLRCSNYELNASDVFLEFCGGDIKLFLQCVFSVLKVDSYELEVKENCMQCIYETSIPSTYFQNISPASSKNEMDISLFTTRIEQLLEAYLHSNAILTLGEVMIRILQFVVQPQLMSRHPSCENILLHFCGMIHYFSRFSINMYTFSLHGKNALIWRQHLLVSDSCVLLDAYFPFLDMALEYIISAYVVPNQLDLLPDGFISSLESALAFLTLGCFGARDLLGRSPTSDVMNKLISGSLAFSLKILSLPVTPSLYILYSRLLQFHINIDLCLPFSEGSSFPSSKGGGGAGFAFLSRFQSLLQDSMTRKGIELLARLALQTSNAVPLLATKGETFQVFKKLLEDVAIQKTKEAQQAILASSSAPREQVTTTTTEVRTTTPASQSSPASLHPDVSDTELDFVTAQLDAEYKNLRNAVADAEDAIHELQVMHDAVLHETEEIVNQSATMMTSSSGSAPDSGSTCQKMSSVIAKKEMRKKDSKASHHHHHHHHHTNSQKDLKNNEGTNTLRQTSSNSSFSVAPSSSEFPPQFVCRWSGCLMKQPVTLPSGNSYEMDILEELIEKVGHVDPISLEPFTCEVELNIPLQRKIQSFLVMKNLVTNRQRKLSD